MPTANMPLAFGAILTGGWLLDKGAKHVKEGLASTPTATTSGGATSTAGSATGPVSGGITGKVSWFGGPNDPSAGGAPAAQLGWVPGIAVYNQQTLGGWWLLRGPNGRIGIVRQMDIGPNPSTGRKFDYSYNLLPLFGYSESSFPTNATSTGIYLGKSIGEIIAHLPTALANLGASAAQRAALLGVAHHLTGSVVA